ncbi:RES domain-containing protein [Paeniglutamicibacter gangotriensis]|uniref:RES domain-containing protein n=1 Tax=Paeniglutamicibacter gangotriensis TaxID=254787 RepID=A0A5B0E1Y3_9MICC|nr:RES family NAD+ phosphorylase [Paeniglutamicibacter gangotriensis]KAA0973024.1 RES domain-containing protein [Paeniglutamicibacter gangotriensis]
MTQQPERQTVWLKAPENGDVTRDFPSSILPNECVRAHSADNGPGWFATVTSFDAVVGGRFDLVVPDCESTTDVDIDDNGEVRDIGTLYCSNDVEAALRERLGANFACRRFIAATDLHDTQMSIIYTHESNLGTCMADTVNAPPDVLTREISTMSDYEVTRAWATSFYETGFDGLAYEPRSTPGRDRIAFAVFGPAGPNTNLKWSPHPKWWHEVVDKGILFVQISGEKATIIH